MWPCVRHIFGSCHYCDITLFTCCGRGQLYLCSFFFELLSVNSATLFSWIIFIDYLTGAETQIIYLTNWISSGSLVVDWSLRVDALTATMLIVVTTVSACVHLYSVGYMSEDKSIIRFMGYLSLFTFFMLMLITSNNLLQMFFFRVSTHVWAGSADWD